jgi:outer membrane protein assembly factor BamB
MITKQTNTIIRRFCAVAATVCIFAVALAVSNSSARLGLDSPKLISPSLNPLQDWPMFGGTPQRNMVNTSNLSVPTFWNVEKGKEKNLFWTADLGSTAFCSPVIVDGKIILGTNNDKPRNPLIQGDRGVVMCFREADGNFLWQIVHEKLAAGRFNDYPAQGIPSVPVVEKNRLYYVSNRCELVCATTDGAVVWRLDMFKDLNVYPHDLAVCSPLIADDLVFVVTGNAQDATHQNVPAPEAPSFLAANKWTGKVVWQSNLPTAKLVGVPADSRQKAITDLVNRGELVQHTQWSSPAYAVVAGTPQVIFPGGDGWLRAFEPSTGRLIWQFDCNPKSAFFEFGGRGTRNELIATPVIHDDKLYISTGQDPEHGDGVSHLWCIDVARAVTNGRVNQNHDVSPVNDNFDPQALENRRSALAWCVGGKDSRGQLLWHRSLSACAVHDGLCYAASVDGYVACFDANSGRRFWDHDTQAEIWTSPFVADGKVYLGTLDGDVFVFQEGREKKLLATNEMRSPVEATPVVANGVLYVVARRKLYAIRQR